ncbi:hypothetical protein [Microbacterium sp. H1-D42]|uniref:hypothetical protein n=1 Tax=Microbacterium sp. H1-D42 TaxID=2925844 RepID=UPI001F536F15|nr:hypothetical protein [Microbacterium sp. H1-D42]UNK69417.1 hypothetical protein MNR00_09475 [Microbacterium sp. H1-D42]
MLVVLVLVVLFYLSAYLWGTWWRHPNFPTPEEFSALFGGVALIALLFAWKQIKQVDDSNRALIESNEVALEVSLETTRPRIQVYLQAERFVSKHRGAPAEGTVYVALTNFGGSAAQNVKLSVDQPFDSLPAFFNEPRETNRDQHFERLNETFDGTVRFDYIRPGAKYIWFLGRAPKLFEDDGNVPRRYRIHASYESQFRKTPYEEDFVIDLDVESRIEAPVDKLTRISKDLEVIGDTLKKINGSIPETLRLDVGGSDQDDSDSSSVPALNSPEMMAQLRAFGVLVPEDEPSASAEEVTSD